MKKINFMARCSHWDWDATSKIAAALTKLSEKEKDYNISFTICDDDSVYVYISIKLNEKDSNLPRKEMIDKYIHYCFDFIDKLKKIDKDCICGGFRCCPTCI